MMLVTKGVVSLLLLLATSCALLGECSKPSDLKLILASVVFRHGDRSPIVVYPKNKYTESFWPQGVGQLSTIGMRQHRFLGSLLRNRYVGAELINPNYTRVQVYVQSTDYDRTLMSAESQLSSFFPPEGDQVFDPSLPWQPIPVHTIPTDVDNLLRGFWINCPKLMEIRASDSSRPKYQRYERKYRGLFRKLEINTGQVPTNLGNVFRIRDNLFVQAQHNIPMPKWLTRSDWRKINLISEYTFYLLSDTLQKQRFTSGIWIEKVVNDMKTRINDPENPARLYLYSAHDATVAAVTSGLGVFNHVTPPYATAFTVELYNDTSTGDHFVSLFYRNETYGTEFHRLGVSSCSNPTLCTLQEFIDHTNPVIPADWRKECGLPGTDTDTD